MLLSYRILFFFIISVNVSFAQQKFYSFKLIDSLSKLNLSYASLSINGTKYYAADSIGQIKLKTEDLKTGDTLRFSHIGYISKTFIISNVNMLPRTIAMANENAQLFDVNISAKKKPILISIGNTHTAYFTGFMTFMNSKYALFVPYEANFAGIFKSVQLKISDRGKGQRMPLKINIYSKTDLGKPGVALINDDIIVSNPKGMVNVVVDISRYNLEVPKTGFFIVAETLTAEYYDQGFVKSQSGQLRNKLPAFFWTEKKKDSKSYSLEQHGFDLKKQWIVFERFNFCFSAKIQVNN